METTIQNSGAQAEQSGQTGYSRLNRKPNGNSAAGFFEKDKRSAFEAQSMAQWIAFGPVLFQVARVLRNTGILQAIDESADGLSIEEIAESRKLSVYGVRVLLESGLGMGLVIVNANQKYFLARTGHFILHDALTTINMNFIHDVCYKGLFDLDKSIQSGKPEGLKELGSWDTIYEGLSQLEPQVQKSWFDFDHYFSDNAFPLVLKLSLIHI